MRRSQPPDQADQGSANYIEAKLLGILLSGVFGQTRPECSAEMLLRMELRPSGVHRIRLPDPVPPGSKPKG